MHNFYYLLYSCDVLNSLILPYLKISTVNGIKQHYKAMMLSVYYSTISHFAETVKSFRNICYSINTSSIVCRKL